MTVYELIQRLAEAPADMEVLVNVIADDMDYYYEDHEGRERCIGLDIDVHAEICDAFEQTVHKEKKFVIDLYPLR